MAHRNRDAIAGTSETIIVSVGGSLIVPDQIDVIWLSSFKKLLEKYIKKDFKFIIICGGGKIARNYQQAARQLGELQSEDLDWLGIHSTRLNAHLLRTVFKNYANPRVIKDPTKKLLFKERVLVAAGWKPGCSTDYDAVLFSKNIGSKKLVNLSNIDYVYSKDPKKFKDAKPVEKISWKEFRKIVGNKWNPGLSAPFDPIASSEGEKLGLEVAIMNGKNLKNLENYLQGKEFIGTIVK